MKTTPVVLAVLLLVAAAAPGAVFGQDIYAGAANTFLPGIDGQLRLVEWRWIGADGWTHFDHGMLAAANDDTRLYLLVNVLEDDVEDSRARGSEGDWIEIVVDVNQDGAVTPGVDIIYTLLESSYDLRIQRFNSFSGLRDPPTSDPSYSSIAAGFGCFLEDGTEVLFPPPVSPGQVCDAHRVWEMAIDLSEVGEGSVFSDRVHLGIRLHSESPGFDEDYPVGFMNSFDNMLTIHLCPFMPVFVPGSSEIRFDQEIADDNGDGVVNDPIEITQAIQHRDNSLRLVADKDTVARVYVEVGEDEPAQYTRVFLYGARDGHDLPGSPLFSTFWAQPDFDFPVRVIHDPEDTYYSPRSGIRKQRDNLYHTVNFRLPDSWVEADTVFFHARARFLDQEIQSREVQVRFRPRKTPYHVVVPVNEGNWTVPVRPAETDIAAAESYIKTIYPVPDIDFLRMEYTPFDFAPREIDGAILYNVILREFINFYNLLVATGTDPLPDQIFAYTKTSRWGQAATFNPLLCTDPGCGHVAGGNTSTSQESAAYDNYSVMAHEINHNIGDQATWAGHVPGGTVDEDSLDPEWVRLWEESESGVVDGYFEGSIREFGFDPRPPWTNGYDLLALNYLERRFTVVPPYFTEVMSYVKSRVNDYDVAPGGRYQHPQKWTSPYRWEHMFDFFEPDPPADGRRRMSYHVSGRIDLNGNGRLDPVFRMPGLPRTMQDLPGPYSLVITYFNGKRQKVQPIKPRFVDNDMNQLTESFFYFQLPTLPSVTKMELIRSDKVLDTVQVSKHPPELKIAAPEGKVAWSGRQVLTWRSEDPDGDNLTYAVFYSPGNVKRNQRISLGDWIPVAWGIQGSEYEVDSDRLPGGTRGRFKVVVTDGFHTVSAISRSRVTVANKPPIVVLLRPAPGDRLPLEPVTFEAHASDLEDGVLSDSSISWFLGRKRQGLGRGKRISAYLGNGVHLITLVAVDSRGLSAEKQFTITVERFSKAD